MCKVGGLKTHGYYLFLFSLTIGFAQAQNSTGSDTVSKSFSLGVRAHYSYIFIHAKSAIPNSDYFPLGAEVNFNWHLLDSKTWEQCNCYPRMGLILSFFDYDNPQVFGQGYTAAYYIEPFFTIPDKINLSVRAAAGLSYLTKPYDSISNPENNAYSMSISGYALLNIGVNYRMNKFWNMNASLNLNHVSNGGIKDPNKGINFPSVSLGADYTFKPADFIKRERKAFNKKDVRLKKSIAVFYASRAISHGEKERFFVYGIGINVTRQVNRVSALGLGAEVMIDYILKEKLNRSGHSDRDYKRAGVLIGHEFIMGRFSFSQSLGVYVYNPARYSDIDFKHTDPVYQRYGLNYKIGKAFFAGINLKAHRQVANFLDIRAGVIF